MEDVSQTTNGTKDDTSLRQCDHNMSIAMAELSNRHDGHPDNLVRRGISGHRTFRIGEEDSSAPQRIASDGRCLYRAVGVYSASFLCVREVHTDGGDDSRVAVSDARELSFAELVD